MNNHHDFERLSHIAASPTPTDLAWIADLVSSGRLVVLAPAEAPPPPPRADTGRPLIDDAKALAEVKWLLANNHARSVAAACKLVAMNDAHNYSVEATTARLRRKYRQFCSE